MKIQNAGGRGTGGGGGSLPPSCSADKRRVRSQCSRTGVVPHNSGNQRGAGETSPSLADTCLRGTQQPNTAGFTLPKTFELRSGGWRGARGGIIIYAPRQKCQAAVCLQANQRVAMFVFVFFFLVKLRFYVVYICPLFFSCDSVMLHFEVFSSS